MSDRWDHHFLELALLNARMSKDPNTKVGAVAVRNRIPVMSGFNGFPAGIQDHPYRLDDRETKLRLVVHAEQNVIALAARLGVPLLGCTLYLAATDDTGMVWGGPPCTRCTVHVIQAGFAKVIARPLKPTPSKWHEDLAQAKAMLEEASVAYREVPRP
jgi:dCMP deaminase